MRTAWGGCYALMAQKAHCVSAMLAQSAFPRSNHFRSSKHDYRMKTENNKRNHITPTLVGGRISTQKSIAPNIRK